MEKIVRLINGVFWYKDNLFHREDGPAIIWKNGDKSWHIDNNHLWNSHWAKLDLRDKIILSKDPHSLYQTVQVLKYIDKDRIQKRIMIPGMEEHIIE